MRTQIGHYEIVSELGRGGMGVVYKGFETALSRNVAIKIMSEALAHDSSVVERFLREARSMAQLNDPHIVQIYFIGEDRGQPFFAMEFVEGETISQHMKNAGRIAPMTAAGYLLQAAQGLAVAHDKGVVHRDIKPANLMLTKRGLVKVTDFGIALAQQDFSKKLTSTGEFVGTPGYLSPEVCLAKPIDRRSDIFSLGIVFFEMLAGRMPFVETSPLGMMLEVVQNQIPDIREINADVGPALHAILSRMLEKDPADRYQSCDELISELVAAGVSAQVVSGTLPRGLPVGGATSIGTPAPRILSATKKTPIPADVLNARTLAQGGPPTLPPASVAAYTGPATLNRPLPSTPSAPPKRQTSLWLPIAAVLLVGVSAIGTAGYVFREQIRTTLTGNDVKPRAGASGDAVDAVSASQSAETTSQPTLADASAAAPVNSTSVQVDSALPAEASRGLATDAAVGVEADDAMAQKLAEQEAKIEALTAAVAAQSAPGEGNAGQRPRAGIAELAQVPARAMVSPPPAPPPPAVRVIPQVAVIAMGDPTLSGIAEVELENALRNDGYTVADENMVSGIDRLKRGSERDLVQALGRAGISGVVLIRAHDLGQRELKYYGRSEMSNVARLDISLFDTVTMRSEGKYSSDSLSYTALSVSGVAKGAVNNQSRQISAALGKHRARS